MHSQVFQNAFHHAPIGMVLVDLEGRCLSANRAFCEMVGYTEAELQHLNFASLTHPDDLPENLALGNRLIAGDLPSFTYEKRYRHKHGHYIWVLLSASVVRDEAGQPQLIISQIQDITEQKRTEAALHYSEASQQAMLNAIPDYMFQLSIDGIILSYNNPTGHTLSVPAAQFLDKDYREVVPAPLRDQLAKLIAEAHATGIASLLETSIEIQDRLTYYEFRASAIEGDGTLIKFF